MSNNIDSIVNTPISREEMAMYIAALQYQSEKIQETCSNTLREIYSLIEDHEKKNMYYISSVADSVKTISNIFEVYTSSAAARKEERFIKRYSCILQLICDRYKIDLEMVYNVIFKYMNKEYVNISKKNCSDLKDIYRNKIYYESFVRNVDLLCGVSSSSSHTPLYIKKIIKDYQAKIGRSYLYTVDVLKKMLIKKMGITLDEFSDLVKKYADENGLETCSPMYYIYKNDDLLSILEDITEGVSIG